MVAQSLQDHARRKGPSSARRRAQGRVLPALVVWYALLIAFTVGVHL